MNFIKHSPGFRAVCLILATICFSVAAVGICFGIDAVNDGYYAVGQEYFENKLLRSRADATAVTLTQYNLLQYTVKENYDGALDRLEHLQRGNTNASFALYNEKGDVLLENFSLKASPFTYTYDWPVYYYSDGSTSTGVRWKETEQTGRAPAVVYDPPSVTTPTSALPEEEPATAPVTEPAAEQTTEPAPEPTAREESTLAASSALAPAAERPTEFTTLLVDENGETLSPEALSRLNDPVDGASSIIGDDDEVYILDERANGYTSVFMYVYPKGTAPDERILETCISIYRDKTYPEEAAYYGVYEIYWQSSFGVSANGEVYYKVGEENYHIYPGQANPQLIGQENYRLEIRIDPAFPVRDVFRTCHEFARIAYAFLEHAVLFTALAAGLGLLLLLIALSGAGWSKKADEPVSAGLCKIPTDVLYLLWGIALIVWFAATLNVYWHRSSLYLTIMAALLPWLLTPGIYIVTVKIKTRTFVRSALLYLLVKSASNALGLLWKLGLFYLFSLGAAAIVFFLFRRSTFGLLLIYLAVKLVQLAGLVVLAVNLHTLQKGARDLADGNYHEIGNPLLFGEFKKHANALNSIGQGVERAVEARIKSEKTKSELITNVSHDLKTPLTSIVNYIELLQREDLQNDKAKEYIEVLQRQAQRLKKLTDDVVDASKAAAGSVEAQKERIDLGVVLSQLCGEYADQMERAGLQLVSELPEAPPTVIADGRLLSRVLDNLMSNAVKYSMRGTRVYLSLQAYSGTAAITLRNISGAPLNVSPEELTERFVRGDRSRNTEGSGLGLYIARSLTELMNGSFRIGIDGDLFRVDLGFPLGE